MIQEGISPEFHTQEAPEKEALLPDGVGLTLEQAKALIAKSHGIILANDEPSLMGVTICNAYLGEIEKLHARYREGLGKLMADKSDAYVSAVANTATQLTKSLSSASVESIRKTFDEHATRLLTLKSNLTWLAAIVAVSALVNVAACVLLGWR